ncbi:Ribosomal L46 protein [Rutstroemia sp. NJR-2017a BVV2]|nr:Ribosomal L46 protein [Rutstroemia sp. NJR-2017a BVV2]
MAIMTASSRGCGRAAARLLNSSTARPRTSTTTRNHTPILPCTTRPYAIAATSLKPLSGPPSQKPHLDNLPPVSPSPAPKTYTLATGIVLSRPPLLTPEQTPFEKSFFLYQKRLNERLALPFTQYFYFKKDTPAIAAWKKHVRERNGVAARDIGGYEAYGEEQWNDEVLVGSEVGEPERVREVLVREAEGREEEVGGEEVQGIEVYPRETEADRKGDMRSLERRLAETLYLVVKGGREGENAWGFPRGELLGREMLHTAAERILHQTAGTNMNTWIVGHVPIGFSTIEPSQKFSRKGEKVFFMKGRIMAGQVDLKGNEMGVTDWKWVTRGELQGLVTPRYYSQVKGMLADRIEEGRMEEG